MADRVCDVDSKFNLCVVTLYHWKWQPKHMFSRSNTADELCLYGLPDKLIANEAAEPRGEADEAAES